VCQTKLKGLSDADKCFKVCFVKRVIRSKVEGAEDRLSYYVILRSTVLFCITDEFRERLKS